MQSSLIRLDTSYSAASLLSLCLTFWSLSGGAGFPVIVIVLQFCIPIISYGLKTSAARFHERISTELRAMGFKPSKADFDLWMRPKDDHCEYVATHIDDITVFSKDCMSIIKRIKEAFDLKQVGVPEYHLGGNFHTISEREAPNTLETGNDSPQHHLSANGKRKDCT